ncbi:methyltransferase domain-containing protein [Candidatus Liberibacter asiaticus]|uniref:SAM-dependent methyltransferase protein n=3 Tax=Liberibacter asiaticus TaxID=34021 RepID=C6XHQ2_LIBAP|nr:methyltransferase domain-containing protein [Candidatus Liberibacter asiaticus]ACT56795.1 SAM-dependent methyltransferase protein [Candidatus Liberibacter asiaticus str. psy62]AGH16562.1 SAM-dependent methyltransferase protein [Candidatus Liberibacter asiaticus str. gxpsy]ALK06954.1 methyltransferase domain-containing protein [Candidatus Liberibacter asiaticus]ASK52425.1 SAM-dependent methyltransferase [Candidatus Liberibacter asiaticus]AWL13751.1 methyltransferase domain-containing protein
MNILFDMQLINRNRLRSFRQKDFSVYFLLDRVAKEIAFRLNMINQTFENALELHGITGIVGYTCMETKKIHRMIRAEISTEFSTLKREVISCPLEEIPSISQSVDLILSPLNLHIINDTLEMFSKINHMLKPGGMFLAAIPGIGTLHELRKALLKAETELTGGASPRVIPFMDIKSAGTLMEKSGFISPIIDQDTYTVYYKSMLHLMHDLRGMGMSNPLIRRSKTPPYKSLFKRASTIYTEENSDLTGNVTASFSIIYVMGWKSTTFKTGTDE